MTDPFVLLISVLAGLVAAGFVWFLWDLAEKIQLSLHTTRTRRRLKREADELMNQAKEPAK